MASLITRLKIISRFPREPRNEFLSVNLLLQSQTTSIHSVNLGSFQPLGQLLKKVDE